MQDELPAWVKSHRSMISRCGGLSIHASTICRGPVGLLPHNRISPVARAGVRPAGSGEGAEQASRHRAMGLRTPLLTIATTPTLTPREREILIMAAGHASQQIAARLGVAVSTVNNHLANAYAKLGIAGRRELVALLGQDGQA